MDHEGLAKSIRNLICAWQNDSPTATVHGLNEWVVKNSKKVMFSMLPLGASNNAQALNLFGIRIVDAPWTITNHTFGKMANDNNNNNNQSNTTYNSVPTTTYIHAIDNSMDSKKWKENTSQFRCEIQLIRFSSQALTLCCSTVRRLYTYTHNHILHAGMQAMVHAALVAAPTSKCRLSTDSFVHAYCIFSVWWSVLCLGVCVCADCRVRYPT